MKFKIHNNQEFFFEEGKIDFASIMYNGQVGMSQHDVPDYEIFKQDILEIVNLFPNFEYWYVDRYEGHNMKKHNSKYTKLLIRMAEEKLIDITFAGNGTKFSDSVRFQKITNWLGNHINQNLTIERRKFTKHFLYMNRFDKWHRKRLFNKMNSSELLDKCEWSYAADNPKHKNHKTIEGIVIDEENSFRESDILPQFQTTFCNIVTETHYQNTEDNLCAPFPTEKTEKCFVAGQPFIAVSTPYFLKQLREWGFETFGDFWDESYDNELDDGKRLEKIFEQIQYISSLSLEEAEDIYYRMIPILQHNQERNNEFHKEQGGRGFCWVGEIDLPPVPKFLPPEPEELSSHPSKYLL